MRAMLIVGPSSLRSRLTVVIRKIKTANVVNISVPIIINLIFWNFILIEPLTQDQIWILIRAIKVQSQILQLYVGQAALDV